MQFAGIFVLIVGFASFAASKESVPPAEGCGEDTSTSTPRPPAKKEYGYYRDSKGCLHYILQSGNGHYPAKCFKTCNGKNVTYRGFPRCMQLVKNPFEERQDTRTAQTSYCKVGRCLLRHCILGPYTQRCFVPNNITDEENHDRAE
uniref:Evasin n=1 Tax=Amblyomma maculatum TaxID=34609 RepID=G3ML31_AMBMU